MAWKFARTVLIVSKLASLSTNRMPPDYAEALVFTVAGEIQAYNARTGDLASPSQASTALTRSSAWATSVRLELLIEGAVSWYRATTLHGGHPRVRVRIGGTTPGIDITAATR